MIPTTNASSPLCWVRLGRKPYENPRIYLGDRVQHCCHRTLDDLVLKRSDGERALLASVYTVAVMECPVCSSQNSPMQIPEPALEVCRSPAMSGAAFRLNSKNASRSRSILRTGEDLRVVHQPDRHVASSVTPEYVGATGATQAAGTNDRLDNATPISGTLGSSLSRRWRLGSSSWSAHCRDPASR